MVDQEAQLREELETAMAKLLVSIRDDEGWRTLVEPARQRLVMVHDALQAQERISKALAYVLADVFAYFHGAIAVRRDRGLAAGELEELEGLANEFQELISTALKPQDHVAR